MTIIFVRVDGLLKRSRRRRRHGQWLGLSVLRGEKFTFLREILRGNVVHIGRALSLKLCRVVCHVPVALNVLPFLHFSLLSSLCRLSACINFDLHLINIVVSTEILILWTLPVLGVYVLILILPTYLILLAAKWLQHHLFFAFVGAVKYLKIRVIIDIFVIIVLRRRLYLVNISSLVDVRSLRESAKCTQVKQSLGLHQRLLRGPRARVECRTLVMLCCSLHTSCCLTKRCLLIGKIIALESGNIDLLSP